MENLEFNNLILTHKPLFLNIFGLTYVEKNKCECCTNQTILKLNNGKFYCFKCWEKYNNNININKEQQNEEIGDLINLIQYYDFNQYEKNIIMHKFICEDIKIDIKNKFKRSDNLSDSED